MNIEQFRKAGYQAIDRICDYYYSLESKPVNAQVKPGYLLKHVPPAAPEEGEDFQIVADDYQKYIIPGLTHWQHPSFFAYFPGTSNFEGILADLYAASAPNPGFNWSAGPACTELEIIVMDWAAKLLGLSSDFYNSSGVGGGCFQHNASESVLVAIIAARTAFMREHPDTKLEDLVIYTTTQTHSLGLKSGLVLGLQVRSLDVTFEDQFSLRGETLRKALEEDTANGKRPFVFIATVGTTSSGAIDNLREINDVLKSYPELWIHIDAAWAGVAWSCPEYREMLQLPYINERANSICVNFHKWGLVSFDSATLWVRDRKLLIDALDVTPPFLRSAHDDKGFVIDYRHWHLGLGHHFRSLKFWFVLRSFGIQGFRKYIRRSIELSDMFVKLISESDQLQLVANPSLALSVFRLVPKSTNGVLLSTEALNDLNKIFYDRIAGHSDISLTQTLLNGIFCIRLAVGSAHTEERHMRQAFDLLTKEAELALATWELVDTSHAPTDVVP